MSETYAANGNLADKAKSVVHNVQDKASELTGDVNRAARDGAAQLGDTARQLGDTAMAKVEGAVGERRSAGAEYIGSIASATEQAAEAFEQDLPQAAHFIRQASEHIHSAADKVREGNARQLVGQVEEFARTQPTLFFGGAVVLGFAALRFLKSTPPAQGGSYDMSRKE